MGRRKKDDSDTEVSLFPFLSILACIIGVLTLMISALALSQMDSDVVVQAEEFEKVSLELEEKEKDLIATKDQVDAERKKFSNQATARQKELIDIQKELTEIQNQFVLAKKAQNESVPEENSEAEPAKQPLEEMEKELSGIKEQIAQLTKAIEEKNLPPEEAEVSVLPGGSGIGVKPRFVECTQNEIVLHNPEGQVRVRAGMIETSEEFLELLDDVAGDAEAKVIFLIRDDGVHVWWRAKTHANSLEVANGKLPVLGHGRLNLEHFHKKN